MTSAPHQPPCAASSSCACTATGIAAPPRGVDDRRARGGRRACRSRGRGPRRRARRATPRAPRRTLRRRARRRARALRRCRRDGCSSASARPRITAIRPAEPPAARYVRSGRARGARLGRALDGEPAPRRAFGGIERDADVERQRVDDLDQRARRARRSHARRIEPQHARGVARVAVRSDDRDVGARVARDRRVAVPRERGGDRGARRRRRRCRPRAAAPSRRRRRARRCARCGRARSAARSGTARAAPARRAAARRRNIPPRAPRRTARDGANATTCSSTRSPPSTRRSRCGSMRCASACANASSPGVPCGKISGSRSRSTIAAGSASTSGITVVPASSAQTEIERERGPAPAQHGLDAHGREPRGIEHGARRAPRREDLVRAVRSHRSTGSSRSRSAAAGTAVRPASASRSWPAATTTRTPARAPRARRPGRRRARRARRRVSSIALPLAASAGRMRATASAGATSPSSSDVQPHRRVGVERGRGGREERAGALQLGGVRDRNARSHAMRRRGARHGGEPHERHAPGGIETARERGGDRARRRFAARPRQRRDCCDSDGSNRCASASSQRTTP